MKKESKKRIVIALICLLLLITMLILVFGGMKNGEIQKNGEIPISSEAAPGSNINENFTGSNLSGKEYEKTAFDTGSNTAEAEGEDAAKEKQHGNTTESAGISTARESKNTIIETEQLDEITAPDMKAHSYSDSASHSRDNSGSDDETGSPSKPQQESTSESDNSGSDDETESPSKPQQESTGESDNSGSDDETESPSKPQQESTGEADNSDDPGRPFTPGDDDIPDAPEHKTAFGKAQEEAKKMGESNYYEFYMNEMTYQEKQELYDSAPSPADFMLWMNCLRTEYERDHEYDLPPEISVGN